MATGATICYLISSFLGEVLVAMPKWKARVDAWKERIGEQDNLLSYMIVIRCGCLRKLVWGCPLTRYTA